MNSSNRIQVVLISLILLSQTVFGQKTVDLIPGEYWWGGQIGASGQMPYEEGFTADLSDDLNGQVQPLLLSNKGRYIWNTQPFAISMDNLKMTLSGADGFVVGQAGESLADAYRYAVENFHSFKGKNPDQALFEKVVYDVATDLGKNLSQTTLLGYAQSILSKGLPAGVLAIGDQWQKDFGHWVFDGAKFSDPKSMMEKLHELEFEVMLTVNPFVSPDSENFKILHHTQDVLFKDPLDPEEPKIIKWWNGYSAMLDFTNPNANIWLKEELKQLKKQYNIDGFKFEGGNFSFYEDVIANEDLLPSEHAALYVQLGEQFNMNEFTTGWKMGGMATLQSVEVPGLEWRHLSNIVPSATTLGLMGHPYSCIDVDLSVLQGVDTMDQELVVRYAQLQAMMPSLKIALLPLKTLDKGYEDAMIKAIQLHSQFGKYISKAAGTSATTGVPLIQSMEYAYPNQGLEFVTDQFMLGRDLLVAPILKRGERSRKVWLPEGIWLSGTGKAVKGPAEVTVDAPIDVLPYFRRGQVEGTDSGK